MSQSLLTELREKAQSCLDYLTDELNLDPVEIPELDDEPNAGYIDLAPNATAQFGRNLVYFHGFPGLDSAHRYIIIEKNRDRVAEIYIQEDIARAARLVAVTLRGLAAEKSNS